MDLYTPVIGYELQGGSYYGMRGDRWHHGNDFFGPLNTPVYAAAEGVVVESVPNGHHRFGRYGQTIIIRHPDGWMTLYAHLNGRMVQQGDRVVGGQQIGLLGDTSGTSSDPDGRFRFSDPHVHFEVIREYPSRGGPHGDQEGSRSINPREWYAQNGSKLHPYTGFGPEPVPWGWIGLGVAAVAALGWYYRDEF